MLVLLDSTVLIDYLRGKPAMQRVFALEKKGDVPSTTAVNIEEIFRGIRPREEKRAHQLLSGLEIIPLDARVGVLAGTWRRDFARRGITLAQPDCLIAAAAIVWNATLVTGNLTDFPMRGLPIQHWPVGG